MFHSIIPAGGSGTRLWPLSRASHPKFLLDLTGSGYSMLQETMLRLSELSESITIVTGRAHQDAVCEQVRDLRGRSNLTTKDVFVVVEPDGRNSMPAIGLATALLADRYGGQALIGSFAADHTIDDEGAFHEAVRSAQEAAKEGYLVTIGIEPTSPSSAYGYISAGAHQVTPSCYLVERFVEKPDEITAEKYVEAGYQWNAGMFVYTADTVLGELAELHPHFSVALTQAAKTWGPLTGCPEHPVSSAALDAWQRLDSIAIDHALAEPLAEREKVAVTSAAMGWSDVGDFTALPKTQDLEPSPILLGSPESTVMADKQVVVLGIPGAIVVDTDDALLITTSDYAQRVGEAPNALKRLGRNELC